MKEIIKKIIAENWDRLPEYIPRNKIPEELAKGKPSIVIIGPRRSGKSYEFFEIKKMLSVKGIDERNFISINFEDERLSEFKSEHFDLILEAFHEIREGKPIFFLDEIQNVEGWEKFIRRLADNGYKTIVSGSNSKMLSSEIARTLGGRFPEITVYPLDFIEFLKFKGIEFKKEHEYSKEKFAIKKYFKEYMNFGAFPEPTFLNDEQSKLKILKSYFNLVFYKDIMARKGIKNEAALIFIIKKLRENIGKMITPRAIYSSLKQADIEVGPNTVETYISYLEEAFLAIPCLPYAKSVGTQERKKRYIIDNGYVKLLEVKEDKGLLLENLVFNEIVKKGKVAYYHMGKKECDFITENGEDAIQVTYELNDENREREIEGLVEAMDAYKIKNGIILTYDQESEIEKDKRKIKVIPAWKWCLQ